MANEFLGKEYDLSYSQLRFYEERHDSLLKYLFTLTTSVATALFAIYQFTNGPTKGFYVCQMLLSAVVFIATVLLYMSMLKNQIYFTYMARQINAIRVYFLNTEAKEFHENQLYTSTSLPALEPLSVHTFQMFGATILSSLFGGILAYSVSPALGGQPTFAVPIIVGGLVLIIECVLGIIFLSRVKGKVANLVDKI
jgi:hypothetical protein